MSTIKYLNFQTYQLATLFSVSIGYARASDIARQFGISKTYARKILKSLVDAKLITVKSKPYRSNTDVKEYTMGYEHYHRFKRNYYHASREALERCYNVKRDRDIARLHNGITEPLFHIGGSD